MNKDPNTPHTAPEEGIPGIPRRAQINLYTSVELAIRKVIQKIEEDLPPDERLTKAVVLLGEAKEWVADYVDGVAIKDHFPRPLLPEGGEGERRKIIQAIGLLNSMVLAGEQHSETSRKIV